MGCGSSNQPPKQTTQTRHQSVYTPPTDFPTPKLLADCQRELAGLDTGREQEVDQNGYPRPFPPKLSKGDVFSRAGLSTVREHALKAPTELPLKPLTELIRYLNRDDCDDLGRLYAAFSWLVYTSQTLHRYELEPTPPKETLLYRLILAHAGYVKYNDIFSDICNEMGLTVKPILGKVKVIRHNLVISEDGVWLAILLHRSWRFVDVDAAVTTLKNKQIAHKTTLDRRKQDKPLDVPFHKYVEFYFLSYPEQLIFSHCPEVTEWQLLARPVTYEEFKVMAHVTESFFIMGIVDFKEAKGVLGSENGQLDTEFIFPEDHYVKLSTSLLKIAGKNVMPNTKGEKLNDLVEVTNTGKNTKDIHISFIDIGRYILKVSAQDVSSEFSKLSADIIAVWFIDCQQPLMVWDINPNSELGEFEPGADMKLLGIEKTSLPISQHMKHFFFRCHKTMYAFRYSLETKSDSHLKPFLVHYTVPDEGSGVILQCPTPGRYVLNVFVKEKLPHRHFKCVCSFIFKVSTTHIDYTTFAKEFNTRIGHMVDTVDYFSQTSSVVQPISHPCPFIQSSSGESLSLIFESPRLYQLMFQYRLQSVFSFDDVNDYVWYSITEKESGAIKTNVNARLPQVGIYTLSIFATVVGKRNDTFREIYRCLIIATDYERHCMPFPEILPDWNPRYRLICPEEGFIKEQEEMEFSLAASDAECISVFHNKSSLYQTLYPTDEGLFSGQVKSLNGGNHLIVSAKLENHAKELRLLKYTVLKNDSWVQLQEEHIKSEEVKKTQENHLKMLLAAEQTRVDKVVHERNEAEKTFKEQFEKEKDFLVEREKKWQKEFESRFEEETQTIENKDLRDLGEQDEAKAVKREIQIILQAQMTDTDNRRKLYNGLSEDIVRQRLRRAIMARDRNDLQKAIDDYYNSSLPSKGNRDLLVAERLLEIAILRDELVDATWMKDMDKTLELLNEIRSKNFEDPLAKEVKEAENMLQGMQRVNRFKEDILNMDKRMMSELRSYQKPPEGVHHVMKAVFLLLGEDEATTTQWSVCATMCNPYGMQGLNRRIQTLDIERLHPEIVARAKQLLTGFQFPQVQRVSSGAALFFMWAQSCIGEYEDTGSESSSSFLDNVKPAGVDRQKELLGKLPLRFSVRLTSRADWTKPSEINSQDTIISPQTSPRPIYNSSEPADRSLALVSNSQPYTQRKYKSKFGFPPLEVSEELEDQNKIQQYQWLVD